MQNKSLQMIKAILKSAFGLFLYSCGVYLTTSLISRYTVL